jgi:hypothetical protein
MRGTRIIVALVVALLGCLPSLVVAQSPSVSSVPGLGHLAEALGFVPPSGTSLAFTDWGRIRASQGAQGLTGASSLDDKLGFLMSTNRDEAAASGFGLSKLRRHRDVWGFDSLDLEWEATYSLDGPPLFVLRFRDGFDLAPVAARFDEYGFSTDTVDGAVIRSHEMDVRADWFNTSEFGIFNTAFLDDGRTLVLSSGLDGVTGAIAAGQQGRLLPKGVTSVLDALDGASSAWLSIDPGTCQAFTPPPIGLGDPTGSIQPLPSGESLHPYTALGVAYARPGWDPVGRIALGFPDAAWAEADADARAEEARTGTSIRTRAPYSEAVFTLEDLEVDDGALVLDVAPNANLPRRLFDMVMARDMTFAGC